MKKDLFKEAIDIEGWGKYDEIALEGAIDLWNTNLEEHTPYSQTIYPYHNHVIYLLRPADILVQELGGEFSLREYNPKWNGKYQLEHMPGPTLVLVKPGGEEPIPTISKHISRLSLTVTHLKTDKYSWMWEIARGYISTIDDLFKYATIKRVPMITIGNQNNTYFIARYTPSMK